MAFFGHERLRTIAIYAFSVWMSVYLIFSFGLKTSLPGGLLGLSW